MRASGPAQAGIQPNSVLFADVEVRNAILEITSTCRLKILRDQKEQLYNARHGAFWGLETTYSLGQAGRFTGMAKEEKSYSTHDRLSADGSRWIVLDSLDLGGGRRIAPEQDFPVLLKMDKKRGIVYVAGKGKALLPDGSVVRLGQTHNAAKCLELLASELAEQREAGAWMAGFLALTDEQRKTVQAALVQGIGKEMNALAKIAAIEALGRMGDKSVVGLLAEMSRAVSRTFYIGDPEAKISTPRGIDWALANVRARIIGQALNGRCPDCRMIRCVLKGELRTQSPASNAQRVGWASPDRFGSESLGARDIDRIRKLIKDGTNVNIKDKY